MDYEQSSAKGKINLKARPRVVKESPVTALIDADAGLGHPAAVMGMELAIEKARAMGVGVVTVLNSHHFGAAGYYAALATKQGLIGLVTSRLAVSRERWRTTLVPEDRARNTAELNADRLTLL